MQNVKQQNSKQNRRNGTCNRYSAGDKRQERLGCRYMNSGKNCQGGKGSCKTRGQGKGSGR
ncbi:MAG: hypothetical protein K9L30_14770 [Desulfobacterales bacterium]|nr:hypothetical protein [Desulfobacterales bacterium]